MIQITDVKVTPVANLCWFYFLFSDKIFSFIILGKIPKVVDNSAFDIDT